MNIHIPVFLDECINGLNLNPSGTYVDCTFGGGGHTSAIAKKVFKVIAIDKDINVINTITAPNVTLIHGDFVKLDTILYNQSLQSVNGILMDLGVSSFQLDNPERGFSYIKEAKLDMRMDTNQALTAYTIINTYQYRNLLQIFSMYGQEPFSKPIAKAILLERIKKNIETTTQLSNIILSVVPKKFGLAPVKRIFQAIRIEVNDELNILNSAINQAVNHLEPCGRLCIITFHSLEDKIVKHAFNKLQNPCICPRHTPYCICGNISKIKVITKKPILPSQQEIKINPRAKSAKLRIAERL